jgi:glycerol uptake facilitator-like aquaporin
VFADSGTGALEQLWAFIVFPMIGAAVGVVLFLMLDDSKVEDTMLSNVPGMTAARDTLGKVADAID